MRGGVDGTDEVLVGGVTGPTMGLWEAGVDGTVGVFVDEDGRATGTAAAGADFWGTTTGPAILGVAGVATGGLAEVTVGAATGETTGAIVRAATVPALDWGGTAAAGGTITG